ncbi:hypothetical protein WC1_26 [Rhodococcus phage WC1]|uniref:Uncharacterized protein n=2 Tax=Rerduovirus RER2 TaxID=1982376 RepID=A0A0K2CM51_9CAUD|nr:hypothetical protein AU091_gp47 [Rhodococcus phage CosmicSans]ALA46229.1 hypothetical protein PBI_RHODALYSA_26 [Rhodococcus phage Rhodalysa]ALN97070.1 hypothetical protein SEA_TWAMP_26 [Rhodococcus phage TWAMP]ALO80624.1 hypothetical protein SEA_LILLIE_26 [Rhodococcus phage Lillie]AOQ27475.1 hypothetical protein SEA_NATOSALEDA_26 [Rhodococcus phage Natosaleda]AWY04038.1 hypothetical protein SEA_SHUMAN_26 [Rhodococcus phage Shuman]AWY04562.1 hypothetical protein PBI_BRADSHAW_26 [Rhodococcus
MSSALEIVGMIAGSGVVGGIVTKVADRKLTKSNANKIDVDAAKVIAETAVTLVGPLKAEIETLAGRVDTLETNQDVLVVHIKDMHQWGDQVAPGVPRPAIPSIINI